MKTIRDYMTSENYKETIMEPYGDRTIYQFKPENESPIDCATRLNKDVRTSHPCARAKGDLVQIENYYSIGD